MQLYILVLVKPLGKKISSECVWLLNKCIFTASHPSACTVCIVNAVRKEDLLMDATPPLGKYNWAVAAECGEGFS